MAGCGGSAVAAAGGGGGGSLLRRGCTGLGPAGSTLGAGTTLAGLRMLGGGGLGDAAAGGAPKMETRGADALGVVVV